MTMLRFFQHKSNNICGNRLIKLFADISCFNKEIPLDLGINLLLIKVRKDFESSGTANAGSCSVEFIFFNGDTCSQIRQTNLALNIYLILVDKISAEYNSTSKWLQLISNSLLKLLGCKSVRDMTYVVVKKGRILGYASRIAKSYKLK